MYAQMTFEIVGRDVLRTMRGIVGGTDVGLAIGEGYSDNLWIPGSFAAECFQHNGRILSRNWFRHPYAGLLS